MRALYVTQTPDCGTLESKFTLGELDDVDPLQGEVIIKNMASTINIDDLHAAERSFLGGFGPAQAPKPSKNKPQIVGTDFAGVIEALGDGVEGWKVGDRVCGMNKVPTDKESGTWSTRFRSNSKNLLRIPESMSFEAAAAATMPAFVLMDMISRSGVKAKDRVLIIGASGGIGSTMVQYLAKTLEGIHVTGVCSGKNADMVRQCGAAEVFDYTKGTYLELLGDGEKFDQVYDFLGGNDTYTAAKAVLKPKGVFTTAVGSVKQIGKERLSTFASLRMLGGAAWMTSVNNWLPGSRPYYKMALPTEMPADTWEQFLAAGITPLIARSVDFQVEEDVREAIAFVRSNRANGKVVIRIASE